MLKRQENNFEHDFLVLFYIAFARLIMNKYR